MILNAFRIVQSALMIIVCLTANAEEVERDLIANTILNRLNIQSDEDATMEAETRIHIETLVRETAPLVFEDPVVSVRAWGEIERQLGILILHTDEEYFRLIVAKSLMDAKILIGVQNVMLPISESSRLKLDRQLGSLLSNIRRIMQEQLLEYYTMEEINASITQIERVITSGIASTTSPAFKQPIDENLMEAFLTEFEGRLIGSIDQIPMRLRRLKHIDHKEERKRAIDVERRLMIIEITMNIPSFLAEHTFDKRMLEYKSDDFAPGYADTVEALGAIEASLFRDRERQRIERLHKDMHMEGVESVIDAAVASLSSGSDKVVPTKPTVKYMRVTDDPHLPVSGYCETGWLSRTGGIVFMLLGSSLLCISFVYWSFSRKRNH